MKIAYLIFRILSSARVFRRLEFSSWLLLSKRGHFIHENFDLSIKIINFFQISFLFFEKIKQILDLQFQLIDIRVFVVLNKIQSFLKVK